LLEDHIKIALPAEQQHAAGWMAGIQFQIMARNVSLLHSIQTSYGADPAFYLILLSCTYHT
jgi:hypothetical protein